MGNSIRGPIQDFFSNAHSESLLVCVGYGTVTAPYITTSIGAVNWTDQTIGNVNYNDVAYSPTLRLFAAVPAAGGNILTSKDGVSWSSIAVGTTVHFNAIGWSDALALFIAVGLTPSGTVAKFFTSSDGSTWTSRSFPAGNIPDFSEWCTDGTYLVGVGDNGANGTKDVYVSTDGLNWSVYDSGNTGRTWSDVAYSPSLNLYAACGYGGTGNKIMTSSDRTTWTIRTTPSPTVNYLKGITWSIEKSLFVTVGYNNSTGGGIILTSSNGTTWSAQTTPSISTLEDVVWDKSLQLFITCGGGSGTDNLLTSPEGSTWTSRTIGQNVGWQGICSRINNI